MAEERKGPREGYVIEHPNREKAASKATKAIVVLLLLVTTALMVIITVGGWDALQGAKPLQIAYPVLFLAFAFLIARWNRGLLPVVAALAVILLIGIGPVHVDEIITGLIGVVFIGAAFGSSLLRNRRLAAEGIDTHKTADQLAHK